MDLLLLNAQNSAYVEPVADILMLGNNDGNLDKNVLSGCRFSVTSRKSTKTGYTTDEMHVNDHQQTEEEEIQLSPGGVLDEETICRCLSNLGPSADGCHQVYLNVNIPGFSLTDISLLSQYEHLQKVEIAYNDITDLSPLGKLKNLVYLDASHNKVDQLLNFDTLPNLRSVDLSWNNIEDMNDLSAYQFLRKLVLDNNKISTIYGLYRCKRLQHLSLAFNQIRDISGLDDLPIQYLNLSKNKITYVENLESLQHLKEMNLSGNCVRSLSGLAHNLKLETLDLESNEVIDILEIKHIKNTKSLRELNLLRNPIRELPNYRLLVLFYARKLTVLDRRPVKETEKVAAVNINQPPMEVTAAHSHMISVVYSFLQPAKIWDSTLPNISTPYPMLVLTGPRGSGKSELELRLVKEFKDYFGKGICHTTRPSMLEEVPGQDYNFVLPQQFEAKHKQGAFVMTYEYCNNRYGLAMESIEKVAREGLACVVNMELEGVLAMKKTYFEPRYILLVPLDKSTHERTLQLKSFISEADTHRIIERADLYIAFNQNHPGFFDMVICSDDVEKAYQQLRSLVMDYLGLTADAGIKSSIKSKSREKVEAGLASRSQTVSSLRKSGSWWKLEGLEDVRPLKGLRLHGEDQCQGLIEEESIKRRKNTAQDLISGGRLSNGSQNILKFPEQLREPEYRMVDATSDTKGEIKSEGHTDQEQPTSPLASHNSSSQSSLAKRNFSQKLHINQNGTDTATLDILPTERVNPLILLDKYSYQSVLDTEVLVSSQTSSCQQGSSYSHPRPGSSRLSFLPAINKPLVDSVQHQ